jgi:hypothetical protein
MFHAVCLQGKVKQIVGSTLKDLDGPSSSASEPVTNFESEKSAAEFASLYKENELTGGHIIMLGMQILTQMFQCSGGILLDTLFDKQGSGRR